MIFSQKGSIEGGESQKIQTTPNTKTIKTPTHPPFPSDSASTASLLWLLSSTIRTTRIRLILSTRGTSIVPTAGPLRPRIVARDRGWSRPRRIRRRRRGGVSGLLRCALPCPLLWRWRVPGGRRLLAWWRSRRVLVSVVLLAVHRRLRLLSWLKLLRLSAVRRWEGCLGCLRTRRGLVLQLR